MLRLDEDLVRVRGDRYDKFHKKINHNRVIKMLYWGDPVDMVHPKQATDPEVRDVEVRVHHPGLGKSQAGYIHKRKGKDGYIPLRLRREEQRLLEVTFVDVQQGDATLIKTPGGKVILIDGGEEKFIARLMAAEFPNTSVEHPLKLDALVVTHGDADHFCGLAELARGAGYTESRKKIHAKVMRYFHNGLVKLPSTLTNSQGQTRKVKETDRFGKSMKLGKELFITDLWQDPRQAGAMNFPFSEWCQALDRMTEGAAGLQCDHLPNEKLPLVRRVSYGDDDAFKIFERDGLRFRVLGPIEGKVKGKPALEFLRNDDRKLSASHTINGHSVVLRMSYGKVNFMLGGDLNTHAEKRLLDKVAADGGVELRSEVLKVPHHGSHEFAPDFLGAVAPVVSVVSSGDENSRKEYVHPRANLVAALGRASRGPEPLLFCTELAAFFGYRGEIQPERYYKNKHGKIVSLPEGQQRGSFHAFQRLAFGAVRVRTDGERVLVAVASASDNIKEAYAFRVSAEGQVTPERFTKL